jgi:hypothetical protein
MTISIAPIKAFVEKKYLHDMEAVEGYEVCKIIGITAYKGLPLTFHILIKDAYIFSNIPVFALSTMKTGKPISNDSLCHVNCPDKDIEVFCLEYLKSKKAKAFFKKENLWLEVVEYYFTIDFYNDNQLMHFVLLENGLFGFVPNHKINFDNSNFLPDYKKNHQNWTI